MSKIIHALDEWWNKSSDVSTIGVCIILQLQHVWLCYTHTGILACATVHALHWDSPFVIYETDALMAILVCNESNLWKNIKYQTITGRNDNWQYFEHMCIHSYQIQSDCSYDLHWHVDELFQASAQIFLLLWPDQVLQVLGSGMQPEDPI